MKKAVNWICVLSFLTVCALVLLFFAPLTETDGSLTYLEWDSGAVVAADGDVTPIDLQSAQPELPEGRRTASPPCCRSAGRRCTSSWTPPEPRSA